jgi:hypothetical protein
MQSVVMLAVLAPGGPPLSTAGFLDRLDTRRLAAAWDPGRYPAEARRVHGAARRLPDIQLRYITLLGRLGPVLDGPGTLADADADASYCILEGTREPSVAVATLNGAEHRYAERTKTEAELAALRATAPAGNDPTLLDELPTVAGVLAGAPPRIKEALLAAFDIYALYSKDTGQVTIGAVLTEDTPGIVALLNDPRTDDD